MIFQLGKLKSTAEKNMGEKSGEGSIGGDTFKRWRDAAARIQGNALPSLSENAYEAASAETALDLELDPRDFEAYEMSSRSSAPAGTAEQQLLAVEFDPAFVRNKGTESNMQSSGVQWPDPRAAIALTKEVSAQDDNDVVYGPEIEGVRLISSPRPAAAKPNKAPSSGSQLGQNAMAAASSLFSGLGFGGERAQGADRVNALRSASTARPASNPSPVTQLTTVAPAAAPVTAAPVAAPTVAGATVSATPTLNQALVSQPIPAGAPSMLSKQVTVKETSMSLEEELRRRFGCNVKSALGPGTIIEGNFSFDSPVCIDGTLIGEVHSSSVLIVGENATVNAKISVGSLIVLGNVTGMVEARELVEVRAGGSLEGDIDTERVAIEEGGWFHGRCNPRVTRKKEANA